MTLLLLAPIYIVIGIIISCVLHLIGPEHMLDASEKLEGDVDRIMGDSNAHRPSAKLLLEICIILFWPFVIFGGL